MLNSVGIAVEQKRIYAWKIFFTIIGTILLFIILAQLFSQYSGVATIDAEYALRTH